MRLEAHGLTLDRGGRRLVDALDLLLTPGMKLAILGPNGSGKTTLIHALAGLQEPHAGRILLDGRPRPHGREWARAVGVLLQEESLDYYGSVHEYVSLGRFAHSGLATSREDDDAIARAMAGMELCGLAHRPLRQLSGGERQRARIAQLLVQSPHIYFMDEPLTHLDLRHQIALVHLLEGLAGQGASVVLSLHEPLWAAKCSHVLMPEAHGRWECGSREGLMTTERLCRLYGCPIDPRLVATL
jgi:iron complex transport system ATP-binding protein